MIHRIAERGRSPSLFLTAAFFYSTSRYLIYGLYLKCMPRIFNLSSYNYQTVIIWDLSKSWNSHIFFIWITKGVAASPSQAAHKMKFFIKDFFSKYDQIRSFLRIWSYLLKKSLMENFIFCTKSGLNLLVTLTIWHPLQKRSEGPCKYVRQRALQQSLTAKNLNYCCKALHFRCFLGSSLDLWFTALHFYFLNMLLKKVSSFLR